jgi:hypothetical protein
MQFILFAECALLDLAIFPVTITKHDLFHSLSKIIGEKLLFLENSDWQRVQWHFVQPN